MFDFLPNKRILLICSGVVIVRTVVLAFQLVGDNWLSKDTADTLATIDGLAVPDVDVTILSPISTPGVLDNEGFEGTNLVVTDGKDGMVEVSTAVKLDDAGFVELEDVLVSFDED